jgi:hypothetical protein
MAQRLKAGGPSWTIGLLSLLAGGMMGLVLLSSGGSGLVGWLSTRRSMERLLEDKSIALIEQMAAEIGFEPAGMADLKSRDGADAGLEVDRTLRRARRRDVRTSAIGSAQPPPTGLTPEAPACAICPLHVSRKNSSMR